MASPPVGDRAGSPSSFWFSSNGIPASTDPVDADSDDDGLSDYFEITTNAAITNFYITNPNDADTDSDGLPDGWEDSNDFFAVDTTGPSTRVIWDSKTQRVYTVQTTTNLLTAPWVPVVPGWTNSGTGGILIYTNTYSDTPRYFQVDVWLTTP